LDVLAGTGFGARFPMPFFLGIVVVVTLRGFGFFGQGGFETKQKV
jgi:hypothetical protein